MGPGHLRHRALRLPAPVARASGLGDLDGWCGLGTTYDFGEVARNRVRGNIQVTNSSGPMEISDNNARGNLRCFGNTPRPNGGGNTAAHKQGQCSSL